MIPPPLLQQMPRQVVIIHPMRDDHHASALGVIEPREDLSVEQFHHPIETLDVIAVFQLGRVVDDDVIRTVPGDPALD